MTYVVAYVLTLVLFALVDITWLVTMGGQLYRQTLGDILLAEVRLAPAVVFYLLYAAGLVIFGVVPSLKSGLIRPRLSSARCLGCLTTRPTTSPTLRRCGTGRCRSR